MGGPLRSQYFFPFKSIVFLMTFPESIGAHLPLGFIMGGDPYTHALQLEHVADVRTAVEAMFASQPAKSREPHINIAGTNKQHDNNSVLLHDVWNHR
jgi:hypothetical protein